MGHVKFGGKTVLQGTLKALGSEVLVRRAISKKKGPRKGDGET